MKVKLQERELLQAMQAQMEIQRKATEDKVEVERVKIQTQVEQLRAASEQLNSLYAAGVQWSKLSEVSAMQDKDTTCVLGGESVECVCLLAGAMAATACAVDCPCEHRLESMRAPENVESQTCRTFQVCGGVDAPRRELCNNIRCK